MLAAISDRATRSLEAGGCPRCVRRATGQHRNAESPFIPRPLRPSSHLQQYSVNPNGWLRGGRGCAAVQGQGNPACPSSSSAKAVAPLAARSISVAKDGLGRAGPRSRRRSPGPKANGFNGEAGRVLLAARRRTAQMSRRAVRPRQGAMTRSARSAPARWPGAAGGRLAFRASPDDPTLAALGLVLGGYVFTRYGKKPGKRRSLRAAGRAPMPRASSASPRPSSSPATSSTRRPTTWGRTRSRRRCATLAEQAQGQGLGHHRRRAARSRTSR